MDDDLMLAMEGRWYLQYTGCPLWLREDIREVSYDYEVQHRGEHLVLRDRVEFEKKGKMRFRWAYDYPVEGIPKTFRWRGLGINRAFRKHFEVITITDQYMVLFFEKTILSPTSVDIVTRSRRWSQKEREATLKELAKNETIGQYMADLQPVDKIPEGA